MLIGEVWLPDAAGCATYLGPGELHTAFNFPFLNCPWDAAALRRVIDETLALNAPVGGPATWVLSNHDVTRYVSRYGRADTSFDLRRPYFHGHPVDLALGTRRARAAALLTMALPGSAYIYQGEELGLWEVEDIPDELRQDPIWRRTAGADPGRDGCRVPLPWSGTEPPFGFSPPGAAAEPWLPPAQGMARADRGGRVGARDSMLSLYREALRIRRSVPAFAAAPLSWRPAPDGVLAFDRGAGKAPRRARRAPGRYAASPTCPPRRSGCPRTPRCCWPAARSTAGGCRHRTPPPGCSRARENSRPLPGGLPVSRAGA